MKKKTSHCPSCFGVLEIVFPEGENGLRSSPEKCLQCRHKTDCLRTAMQSPAGIRVREVCVDRAYDSGMMGFLERWSRKKAFQRRLKIQKEKES